MTAKVYLNEDTQEFKDKIGYYTYVTIFEGQVNVSNGKEVNQYLAIPLADTPNKIDKYLEHDNVLIYGDIECYSREIGKVVGIDYIAEREINSLY